MSQNHKPEVTVNCGNGPFNIRNHMNTHDYQVVLWCKEFEDWAGVSEYMPKGCAAMLAITLNEQVQKQNSVDWAALRAAGDPLDRE